MQCRTVAVLAALTVMSGAGCSAARGGGDPVVDVPRGGIPSSSSEPSPSSPSVEGSSSAATDESATTAPEDELAPSATGLLRPGKVPGGSGEGRRLPDALTGHPVTLTLDGPVGEDCRRAVVSFNEAEHALTGGGLLQTSLAGDPLSTVHVVVGETRQAGEMVGSLGRVADSCAGTSTAGDALDVRSLPGADAAYTARTGPTGGGRAFGIALVRTGTDGVVGVIAEGRDETRVRKVTDIARAQAEALDAGEGERRGGDSLR
ncbi:hypothetical protein SAMN05445756_0205 [Kytococcus aerolatus]|uniref:PknH-like extracellular domain-containing protein n=1 Tax=Kytococcus aerolatus TaxID=592308 RepID=A0A212T214_9MICO|nr:hypothetical protein [Kytococcus aerolatus]SNC60093.1 hypothetical protein SAMN05445756_0205 [Kytococcus aerolatus]